MNSFKKDVVMWRLGHDIGLGSDDINKIISDHNQRREMVISMIKKRNQSTQIQPIEMMTKIMEFNPERGFWYFINLGFKDLADIYSHDDLNMPFFNVEIWTHSGQGILLQNSLEAKYRELYNGLTSLQQYRLSHCYQDFYNRISNVLDKTKYGGDTVYKTPLINYILSLGQGQVEKFLQMPEKELEKKNKYFSRTQPRELWFPLQR